MKLTKAEKKRMNQAETQEKTRASKVKADYYKAKTKEAKAKAKLHKSKKSHKRAAGGGISLSKLFK